MAKAKIAITIDRAMVERVDRLVASRAFPSRSEAIQAAVEEKLARLDHTRLAAECAKLDRDAEKALAEEGLGAEIDEWPEY
ncbi:MAG TPA: ribbon-helix-helix domain-containing protein [Planctomycetota bacterium]|nr:ribbon-helix-helix domain-containing protein [Planctomycetota bacterium]